MRTVRRGAVLGVLVGVLAALLPATGAAAVTPLKATITCDSRLGWIHTGLTGGAGTFFANLPVNVEFRVLSGSYVTATTWNVPPIGTAVTTAATTAPDGSLSVPGYGRPWRLSADLFYSETVQVTVTSQADGRSLWQGQASCLRDVRTTVTLGCDQATQTITARVDGVDYDKPQPMPRTQGLLVTYKTIITSQATKDDPRFTVISFEPQVTHLLPQPTTSTFSDVGYTRTIPNDPWYYAESLTVEVWEFGVNLRVGAGAATCVLDDKGA